MPVLFGALFLILAGAAGVWILSLRLRDASIADICWGPGFALLGWYYCVVFSAWRMRSLLLVSLVTIWAARLAIHIGRRHRGGGEDARYTAMRREYGIAFWWRSLLTVFWLQGALLWLVALPLFAAARVPGRSGITTTDVMGTLLFVIGFAFEAIGDYQLARFKASAANRGRVMDQGLWRYTRHPNYFGDATLWWGVYLIAASVPGGWLTIASPMLMTMLLLRVSGVTLLERTLKASKPGYAAYVARTSAFIPWRPRGGE